MKFLSRSTFAAIAVVAAIGVTRMTMVFAQVPPGEKVPTNPRAPKPPEPPTPPAGLPRFGVVSVQPGGEAGLTVVPGKHPNEWGVGPTVIQPGFPSGFTIQQFQEERETDMKAHEIVVKLKEMTDETERAAAVQELTALMTTQFNARQKHRDEELAKLEEQLKKLRAIQQKREAARADIIGERVRQLVRESEGLNWGGAQTGPSYNTGIAAETVNVGGNRFAAEHGNAGGKRFTYIREDGPVATPGRFPWTATAQPFAGDQVRVFALSGVDGEKEASEMVEVVEKLISGGPERTQVIMTTMGNKIIVRGSTDGLKIVDLIMKQVKDELKGGKTNVDRDQGRTEDAKK